ncbi:MAG: ZIP family metal transporter [Candidatus Micrarchaeota archaeon]
MAFFDLLFGALLALFATTLGSLLVMFSHRLGLKSYAYLLGFSGGVMAFASVELLLKAYGAGGAVAAFGGFAAGAAVMLALNLSLPHAHLLLTRRELGHSKRKAFLLAGTITLHNIPEGLSLASAFALSVPLGWVVAFSIAIQDVVEGFAVSAPLAFYGMGMRQSMLLGAFSGVVELAAAVAGFFLLSSILSAVPFALAFSSGSMAFVVFHELMPDAHEKAGKYPALWSLAIGAVCAATLALLLGF